MSKTPKRGRGQPTKLTPEVAAKVAQALDAGMPIDSVGAFVGVSARSIYAWMKRGFEARAGEKVSRRDQPYVDFLQAVERAVASWEHRQLQTIEAASKHVQQWTAAAWLLERRQPHKYGRRDRVDHRHELAIEVGSSRPEELEWTEEPNAQLPPGKDPSA